MDREEDQRRYFLVGSAIFEVVTPLLRHRLENHYKNKGCSSLQAYLDKQTVVHILFHLRYRDKYCCCDRAKCKQNPCQPLVYNQWKLLYKEKTNPSCSRLCHSKFTANQVHLYELDLTLVGLLVLECTNLSQNEYTSIAELRQFRNEYLGHNTDGTITEDEFDTIWQNLITNINQLDPNQEDILRQIKNRTFDERLCRKYMTDLLDVYGKLNEVCIRIEMVK